MTSPGTTNAPVTKNAVAAVTGIAVGAALVVISAWTAATGEMTTGRWFGAAGAIALGIFCALSGLVRFRRARRGA